MIFNNIFRFSDLQLVAVYRLHDRPLLTASLVNKDSLFIGVMVYENKEKEIWLYVKISEERFNAAENNEINLYNIFAKAENGLIYKITSFLERAASITVTIEASELRKRYFPFQDEFLCKPIFKVKYVKKK